MNVFPDALILEVHDRGALVELRGRLAPAVDGAFRLPDSPYLPHVTVAMFADTSVTAALRERLTTLRERAPAAAIPTATDTPTPSATPTPPATATPTATGTPLLG